MTNDEQDTKKNKWIDFNVKNEDRPDNVALFKTFKLFKERVSKLSKPELRRLGWLSEDGKTSSLVDMFRDTYNEQKYQLFRQANTSDAAKVSAWLSRIKSHAEIIALSNELKEFSGITKKQLSEISRLSVDENILPKLPEIMLQKGIILVYERCLPGTKIDGIVFTLSNGHPVIGISFRYSRLDYFWFTLMHELSHINLHLDSLQRPILEDFDIESVEKIELSANRLAKFSLVDREAWRNCKPKYDKNPKSVENFAKEVGIHKSVVAGLLRRELDDYSLFSDLVNEVDIREVVFGHG